MTSNPQIIEGDQIALDERQRLDDLKAESKAGRVMFIAAFAAMNCVWFFFPDNQELFLAFAGIGMIGMIVHQYELGKTDREATRLEKIHSRPPIKRRYIKRSMIISAALAILVASHAYFVEGAPLWLALVYVAILWAANFALDWWQSIRPKPQLPVDAA
jgi:hypothetical protein